MNRLSSGVKIGIKIFLFGLLLQFLVHTFFTFKLGLDGSGRGLLWAWKEIAIVAGIGLLTYIIVGLIGVKKMRRQIPLRKFIIIGALFVLLSLFTGLVVHQIDIALLVNSLRYSIAGYVVFLIGFGLAWWLYSSDNITIQKWYIWIIKRLLWFGLLWYCILFFIPNFLKLFGYNQYNYEGTIGEQPPAAYYTNYREGLPRNQFLFERPISWGFFLVALWPLFMVFVLRYKPLGHIMFWTSLYGANVLLTFSRAAWIARFVQCFIMFFLLFRHQIRRIMIWIGIPTIVIGIGVIYLARDAVIDREYSNLGHIQHTMTALQKIGESPFWGEGPGSAGPASHSPGNPGYNPENQYLQIWIEYGLRGFIAWMWLYIWLLGTGWKAYHDLEHKKLSKKSVTHHLIIIACAVGLLGLSIEGLFLHSFVDRMIVYPFMLIFGLSYAAYYKSKHHGIYIEIQE